MRAGYTLGLRLYIRSPKKSKLCTWASFLTHLEFPGPPKVVATRDAVVFFSNVASTPTFETQWLCIQNWHTPSFCPLESPVRMLWLAPSLDKCFWFLKNKHQALNNVYARALFLTHFEISGPPKVAANMAAVVFFSNTASTSQFETQWVCIQHRPTPLFCPWNHQLGFFLLALSLATFGFSKLNTGIRLMAWSGATGF